MSFMTELVWFVDLVRKEEAILQAQNDFHTWEAMGACPHGGQMLAWWVVVFVSFRLFPFFWGDIMNLFLSNFESSENNITTVFCV